MDTLRLGRWERYYLEHAPHGQWVELPKNSPVIDRMIEQQFIARVGLVAGEYARFNLTTYGKRVARQLQRLATDPDA